MDINNLTRKDLIEIIEKIRKTLKETWLYEERTLFDNSRNRKNDLEDLIGTIPFLLLNQQIFEKNQDIADFANKLGIKIPSPEKKKKEDIIGRVVSAIAKFDRKKIYELNIAIKSLKRSDVKKGKSNFFKDWEDAIKQMKI